MGDGKITLQCLGSCEANFDITELQKALKPEFFSKWFRKIQMAEIGEVSITSKKQSKRYVKLVQYLCSILMFYIIFRLDYKVSKNALFVSILQSWILPLRRIRYFNVCILTVVLKVVGCVMKCPTFLFDVMK